MTLNPLNDTILNFGIKDIETTLPTGQQGTFTKDQQLAFLYNNFILNFEQRFSNINYILFF